MLNGNWTKVIFLKEQDDNSERVVLYNQLRLPLEIPVCLDAIQSEDIRCF